MTNRAIIVGCAGPSLTADERAFFRDADPWGFILFRRNVESREQLRALTDSLRDAVGRADAPVSIDQEGGRVQRMGPPHWQSYPPGAAYRASSANDEEGRALARLGARLIAHDLLEAGINMDCLPVLDVPIEGAHNVIGDRAYANDPATVALYGRAACEGLLAGGVLPVIKHMPGHGRAFADSHHDLPVVDTPLDELKAHDFEPFRALADMPVAMTAHVVYTAVDPDRPATTSPKAMSEILRGYIGYDGLVMSDDLSMNALQGTLAERARASFAAGCDVGLHCNGSMDEMVQVAGEAPILAGDALRRAAAAMARIARPPEPLDLAEARARFAAAFAPRA